MDKDFSEPIRVIANWLEVQRDYKNIPSISAGIVVGDQLMKHIDGDIFKRLRDDGKLGEEIKFERNQDDKVFRFWQHSVYIGKIDV